MIRSRKPHRRYTRAEATGIDAVRQELTESGLRALIDFANGEAAWSSSWPKIHGERYTQDAADELCQEVRADLLAAIRGRLSFGSLGVELTLTYQARNGRVTVEGPQSNLDEYLTWLLAEAVRSGHAKRLRRCLWRACGRFFVCERRSKRYCSSVCQDAVSNARRAATRRRQRRHYDKWFRTARRRR